MNSYDLNYLIEKAFMQALANVSFENDIIINDNDIVKVKLELNNNNKIKTLIKGNDYKNERR